MTEYIGVRGEIVSCDINGNPFYNMYLTNEEIIRCRDCKHARRTSDGKVEWCAVNHDKDGFCLNVMDYGFCAWAERDA